MNNSPENEIKGIINVLKKLLEDINGNKKNENKNKIKEIINVLKKLLEDINENKKNKNKITTQKIMNNKKIIRDFLESIDITRGGGEGATETAIFGGNLDLENLPDIPEREIPPGWIGGFEKSNPSFAYPNADISSLPMQGNLANIDKITRQVAGRWPEFSWNLNSKERLYQRFATNITRIGYTDEGRVYSVICPQQGFYSSLFGNVNIEMTVTGTRGWINEQTKEARIDISEVTQIWFSPSANQNKIVKLIEKYFQKSKYPFPFSKSTAIGVLSKNITDPEKIILPMKDGKNPNIENPPFTIHENAWSVLNVSLEVSKPKKTGIPVVDAFNQLIIDLSNIGCGNMLKEGNILNWNVWLTSPTLVDQKEWKEHAERWRESINEDHGNHVGGPRRNSDGSLYIVNIGEAFNMEIAALFKFLESIDGEEKSEIINELLSRKKIAKEISEWMKGIGESQSIGGMTFINRLEKKMKEEKNTTIGVYGLQLKSFLDMLKLSPSLFNDNIGFYTYIFGEEYNECVQSGNYDSKKCPFKDITYNFPGDDCLVLNGNSLVRSSGPKMIRKLDDGTFWRGPQLGWLISNPYLYQFENPNKKSESSTIKGPWGILSFTPEMHTICREYLTSVFPQNIKSKNYFKTLNLVKSTCNEYIKKWRDTRNINLKNYYDFVIMTVDIIYRLMTGKKMSKKRLDLYGRNVSNLNNIGLFISGAFPASLYDLEVPGHENLSLKNMKRFMDAEFILILEEVSKPDFFKGKFYSASQYIKQQISILILQTCSSAGGLSVPNLLAVCIALQHASNPPPGYNKARLKLEKDNLESLKSYIWECIRMEGTAQEVNWWTRRPTCVGLTQEETKALGSKPCPFMGNNSLGKPSSNLMEGGYRMIQNFNLAERDPKVWGSDANQFKLRPLEKYEKYSTSFARHNKDPTYKNGTRDRNCPGEMLAFLILENMLPEFLFNENWITIGSNPGTKPYMLQNAPRIKKSTLTALHYVEIPQSLPIPGLTNEGYGIVVSNFKGLKKADKKTYFVLRIGKSNSLWEDKPRGSGCRDELINLKKGELGCLRAPPGGLPASDLEMTIRIYEKISSKIIAEATSPLEKIMLESEKKPISIKLIPEGEIVISIGPMSILQKTGLQVAPFEDLSPLGEIKKGLVKNLINPELSPLPPGKAPLPKNLRGIFWMTGQSSSGSLLVTFAGPNNSGDGCSSGILTEEATYKMRTSGNNCWAFAGNNIILKTQRELDLVYEFQFNNRENPTFFQISAKGCGENEPCYSILSNDTNWLIDLTAQINTVSKYPNSIAWQRNTKVFEGKITEKDFSKGSFPEEILAAGQYELIQIVDENGNPLEPAWTDFVNYKNNVEKTGKDIGEFFYNS